MNRFCAKVKHVGILEHNMSWPKNKKRYCQTFIFMCSKIPVLPNFEQNISFLLYPIFNTRHQEVKFQKNLKSFTESFKLAHFANSPAIHTPQMPHFGQRFFSKLPTLKSNILRHNLKIFESKKFISDFDQTGWEKMLCSEKNDINFSLN